MDTVRRPLCGCFVLSCMVGGIFRKPLGFRRCLPPARPEKAKPFQAGRSPCTKHQQTVRLRLYEPKKFLRVPRGVFQKRTLGREWDGVPQRVRKPVRQNTPFQAGRSPFTKRPQTVRLCLYEPKKVFEGSKGRFFKNAPWQGVGRSPTESRRQEKGRFTVQTPERTSLFRRFLPDSAARRPPWRQAHPVFGFR